LKKNNDDVNISTGIFMTVFAMWPLSLLVIGYNLLSGLGISGSVGGGIGFFLWSTIATFILAVFIGTPIFAILCSLGLRGAQLAISLIIAGSILGWWFGSLFGEVLQYVFIVIGMYGGCAYWYGATKLNQDLT
jgi:hypothetical protein